MCFTNMEAAHACRPSCVRPPMPQSLVMSLRKYHAAMVRYGRSSGCNRHRDTTSRTFLIAISNTAFVWYISNTNIETSTLTFTLTSSETYFPRAPSPPNTHQLAYFHYRPLISTTLGGQGQRRHQEPVYSTRYTFGVRGLTSSSRTRANFDDCGCVGTAFVRL